MAHLPARSVGATRARHRLFIALLLFVIGLAVPIYFLFARAYQQLEQQSLYQIRFEAESVAKRVDAKIAQILSIEEGRNFSDYVFLNVTSDKLFRNQALQVSPLSRFPPANDVPGLVGYFQIEPDGNLSTPYLPNLSALGLSDQAFSSMHGVSASELQKRRELEAQLRQVVATLALSSVRSQRALLEPKGGSPHGGDKSAEESAGAVQTLGERRGQEQQYAGKKIAELELETSSLGKAGAGMQAQNLDAQGEQAFSPQAGASKQASPRQSRKEQISIPALSQLSEYLSGQNTMSAPKDGLDSARMDVGGLQGSITEREVISFEGDIDPLQASLTSNGRLVFYRKVWRSGVRYVQGFVVSAEDFMKAVIEPNFHASSIGDLGDLIIAYQDSVFENIRGLSYEAAYRGEGLVSRKSKSTLTFSSALPPPLNQFSLLFTAKRIPLAVGTFFVYGLACIIGAVLLIGALGIYRVGLRQIELAEKKSDFVSAVSHELKTPLTTIRMYAEMLRAGYVADPEKQHSYYDYILSESERLSRLVSNVLELSRISQGRSQLKLQRHNVRALLERACEKVNSLVEMKGFKLVIEVAAECDDLQIEVDEDAFSQIAINLVDNALKFSRDATNKTIILGCRVEGSYAKELVFFVRDFGPGVAAAEQRKIFELFYRAEQEMVRTTTGTGIGLALVKELAERMRASVDMRNVEPGAEFQIRFREA